MSVKSLFVRQVLGPRLPALLPVLVRGMRYSEMDVILLRGDRDDDADDAEPDRDSDIRPRFHKPRSHTIKHNGIFATDKSPYLYKLFPHQFCSSFDAR